MNTQFDRVDSQFGRIIGIITIVLAFAGIHRSYNHRLCHLGQTDDDKAI